MNIEKTLFVLAVWSLINGAIMIQIAGNNYPKSHPVAAGLILVYLLAAITTLLVIAFKTS